jgi:hypothetical protein
MSAALLLHELRRRDPLLPMVGLAMLAGLAIAAALALIDSRLILGINPWIKPMKFLSSIAIFLGTMAWFMPEAGLRHPRRLRIVRWTMVLTMIGEVVLISVQSARGTTSHFNIATVIDAVIFQAMGLMIVANTVAVATFLFSLRPEVSPSRAGYLSGMRLGLAVFVIGSLEGFVMTTNMAHTIPGPDGGPGLPFVNWSTTGGDLRIAHFLGLHALQALPFMGYLLDRTWSTASPAARAGVVVIGAVAWAGLAGVMLWLAVTGRPLVAL